MNPGMPRPKSSISAAMASYPSTCCLSRERKRMTNTGISFVVEPASLYRGRQRHLLGPRVARLIDAQSPTAGQRHVRQESPALILHRTAGDMLPLHLCDECGDVVEHQIEAVQVGFIPRMDGDLGRWQAKNQPSIADVDVGKLEDVAKKRAIGPSVRAVDDRMCTHEHGQTLLIRAPAVRVSLVL